MKKRNCFARGLSFSLAGVLLLTGCGGLEKAGEIPAEENRYTEAAGEDRDGAYYSTDSAGDMSEGVAAADEAPADLADEATSGSQKYAENEIFDGLLNDQKVMEEDSYLDSCYEWEPGDYSGEEYSEWDEKGFSVVLK